MARARVLASLVLFLLAGALSCLSAPLCTAKPATAAGKTEEVWVVKQVTEYFGPITLYVGQTGVKCVVGPGDINMVCAPPNWDVCIYSKNEKKQFTKPLPIWYRNGFGMVHNMIGKTIPQNKTVFDSDLKIECLELTSNATAVVYGARDPLIFRSTHGNKRIKQSVYRFAKVKLEPEPQHFLAGLYNLKNYDGIPLFATYEQEDGGLLKPFYTKAISTAKIDPVIFTYPVGLAHVANQSELLFTKARTQQMHDVINSLLDEEGVPTGKAGDTKPVLKLPKVQF